jgi:SnoaL-like domain
MPDTAKTMVLGFLAAMEQRDLKKAQSYLAEDFAMSFPGGTHFTTLEELTTWSKNRYRFVRKTIDAMDAVPDESGTIVYCSGTLAGEWPDGSPFSSIRFIDRLVVRDGKLAGQEVWNDLAEARVPRQ